MTEPGRAESATALAQCPRLAAGEPFDLVCAGCGDCCRNRRDLVLSGYDLYRIARRLGLPPRLTADAFCKQEFAPQTLLPAVVLRPNARTGNCPFFEADACTIHAARPLACALYPLGQAIDPATAAMEYYVQLPLCGTRVSAQEQRTLQNYLDDAAITARAGIDARWAVVCTQLSDKLQQAGGREQGTGVERQRQHTAEEQEQHRQRTAGAGQRHRQRGRVLLAEGVEVQTVQQSGQLRVRGYCGVPLGTGSAQTAAGGAGVINFMTLLRGALRVDAQTDAFARCLCRRAELCQLAG